MRILNFMQKYHYVRLPYNWELLKSFISSVHRFSAIQNAWCMNEVVLVKVGPVRSTQ